MISIFVISTIFQSKRLDNNAQAFYYPWAPIPQTSNIITWAYFSIGNGKWIFDNVPKDDQPYTDWYFTHQKVYDGAVNLSNYILLNTNEFAKSLFSKATTSS